MRRFAPWIAVGTLATALIVGGIYRTRLTEQAEAAPKPPTPLEESFSAAAEGWEWSYSAAGKPKIEVRAKDFKHVREPSVFDLAGVELKIFHLDGAKYDRVVSPKAQFSVGEGTLRSDADVEITMGLTEGDVPQGRLIGIDTSGVTFENKTGRADTEQHAKFRLDVGEGEADGVTYDPQTRELRLKRNVKLLWRGNNPDSPPMRIESGELIYQEGSGKVLLLPWSKFSRETLSMNGGSAEITLENGNIRLVSAAKATGVDRREKRTTEFGADQLEMIFRDGGIVEKITGQSNARLRGISATAQTAVTADRLDLSFKDANGSATLERAFASGKGIAESTPVNKAGAPAAETRVLKSEMIEMRMRDGGEDVEQIDTHAHGTLEFLPNRAGQRKRLLDAERMSIQYGLENRLKSFRGVQVKTVTDPDSAVKGSQRQYTWSEDLQADFDPKSGDLSRLEQWGKFRFEEGVRKARSERALIDPGKDWITLTGDARVWDPTGATDAAKIQIDQKNRTTIAQGDVRTVRQSDAKDEEPMRAIADRMKTTNGNAHIRYEGKARLWQGGNRVEGALIEIDRPARELRAEGGIVNTLQEKTGAPTVVEARTMRYADTDRVAFYEGGVRLRRPDLNVRSRKLRAYLSGAAAEETTATVPDSGLDRAFAEGDVEIVQRQGPRTKTGTGHTADYYAADGRVVVDGDPAELTDITPGLRPSITRGRKLTWFGNVDKLLVDGAEGQPAVSSLRRKK